jgi:hypothetical protein
MRDSADAAGIGHDAAALLVVQPGHIEPVVGLAQESNAGDLPRPHPPPLQNYLISPPP